jgi:Holliday junction resolvasome RuvABC DNA-binding subunit
MKTAFSRLVVSLLSLLTVVVALATSLGKLLVTVVGLLTAALERAVEAIKSRRSNRSIETQEEAPEAPRANLRVLPNQSSKRDELTRALTGLKFPMPAVKRFVATLTENDMKQDIRDLIKAGLKEMAA